MLEPTLTTTKQKMTTVLTALREQLTTLQVGRANASLVEGIEVESYGTKLPLKQVASVTVPEGNQLLITPWDKGALQSIETAIRQSDLGVNPINDGKAVRIVLPTLTEERRKELVRLVGKLAEEARIALRHLRHEAWEMIQSAQKTGTMTEDDRERGRAELDKLIDGMNQEVEQVVKTKEQEMLNF